MGVRRDTVTRYSREASDPARAAHDELGTQLSPAGAYPIVPGGADSPNYTIENVSGVLVGNSRRVRALSVSIQRVHLARTKKTTGVIVLQFSGALNAGNAQNIGNYSLASSPITRRQHTRAVALSQATYNPAYNTVRLVTHGPLVLNPTQRLTLFAAGLLDASNLALDGNHDGLPGGNCVVTISMSGATIA